VIGGRLDGFSNAFDDNFGGGKRGGAAVVAELPDGVERTGGEIGEDEG
jgi:hypothetical protein